MSLIQAAKDFVVAFAIGFDEPAYDEAGYAAAVYYTAHPTLASAALFLVSDLIARQRLVGGDRFEVVDAMPHGAVLGTLFFVTAVTIAGLPPLSGFIGKLFVLEAGRSGSGGDLVGAAGCGAGGWSYSRGSSSAWARDH